MLLFVASAVEAPSKRRTIIIIIIIKIIIKVEINYLKIQEERIISMKMKRDGKDKEVEKEVKRKMYWKVRERSSWMS